MNGQHQYHASRNQSKSARYRMVGDATMSTAPSYFLPTTETSSASHSVGVHNTGKFGVNVSTHSELARYPGIQDTSASSSLQRSRSQSQSISTGPSSYTPLSLDSTVSPTEGLPPDTLRQRLYQISLRGESTETSYDQAFDNYEEYSLPPGEDDGQPLSTFALYHAISPTIAGYNSLEPAWPSHHIHNNTMSSYGYPFPYPLSCSAVKVPIESSTSIATRENTSGAPCFEYQQRPSGSTTRPVQPKLAPAVSSNETGNSLSSSGAVPVARHHDVPSRRGRTAAANTPHTRKAPERKICEICQTDGQKKKYEFRGQHELDRHNNKQHSQGNRRWICLDPTPDQRHSWCKNCRMGKAYAINYNAAEHIRRSHLYPDGSERPGKRALGALRGGGRKAENRSDDKGSGSGRMPSIQDLIKAGWMKLVLLPDSPDPDIDDLDDSYDREMSGSEYPSQVLLDVPYKGAEPNSGGSTVRQGNEDDRESPPRFSSTEMNWHPTDTYTFSPVHGYRLNDRPESTFDKYYDPAFMIGDEQRQSYLRRFDIEGLSPVSMPQCQLSSPDPACSRNLSMHQP